MANILTTLSQGVGSLKNIFRKQSVGSAQTGAVDSEMAHPSVNLTPQRLHQLLTDAEKGDITRQSELFADMEEKDGHIFAEMDKRKRAVISLPWHLEPPKNASQFEMDVTKALEEMLGYIDNFEDVTNDALSAIGHGFACQEINFANDGQFKVIESLDFIHQRRFKLDNQTGSILLRNGIEKADELWEMNWLVHKHQSKSGYLSRSGLFRVLAFPYLFKNFATRDIAEFLEIYGLPLRLGTYPSGAKPEEKATLMRAVVQIGHRAAGIIPQGMQIDFKEAAKGSSDPFLDWIAYLERVQSKVILGGTLTSQADGKSSTNALGNIHEITRKEIRDHDVRQLAGTYRKHLIGKLAQLNFPNLDAKRLPHMVFDTAEAEDIQVYADALPKLVGVGMPIPTDWAHGKLKIPVPEDGQAVLATQQNPPADNQADADSADSLTASLSSKTPQTEADKAAAAQQTLDEVIADELSNAQLNEIANSLTVGLVRQLQALDNFDDALALLTDTLPDKDITALADTLEQYVFAGEAWGKLNNQKLNAVQS